MSPSLLAAAAVFNLLCRGTLAVHSSDVSANASTAERLQAIVEPRLVRTIPDYSTEYRVDLDRGRWCLHSSCETSSEIEQVTDATITLLAGPPLRREGTTIEINRETGGFFLRSWRPNGFDEVRGKCFRGPSPGLPSRRF